MNKITINSDIIIDILGALTVFALMAAWMPWWKAVLFALCAIPFAHCWVFVAFHWLTDTHNREGRLPQTLIGLLFGIIMFCLIAI